LKVVTGSIQLLSLPQDENQAEGAKTWYSWGNSSGNVDGIKHPNKEHFRDAIQVIETLISAYAVCICRIKSR
jgi:hypothetical protein